MLGVDLERLAGPDRLFYGILAPLLGVGLFGIFSVVASMVFSTVALRSLGADNIVGRGNFTKHGDEGGEIDGTILDRCVRMSRKERYALYRAHIQRLGDLARSSRRMDKYVRLAHMCLLYGLVAISVISAVVIAGMLYSLGAPQARAVAIVGIQAARRQWFHVAAPIGPRRGARTWSPAAYGHPATAGSSRSGPRAITDWLIAPNPCLRRRWQRRQASRPTAP